MFIIRSKECLGAFPPRIAVEWEQDAEGNSLADGGRPAAGGLAAGLARPGVALPAAGGKSPPLLPGPDCPDCPDCRGRDTGLSVKCEGRRQKSAIASKVASMQEESRLTDRSPTATPFGDGG